eukprot:TRINITY_DN3137_c0_g1_i1.p1 TRINITY_DN3137_c0_g1~~TRINITY_DN3137_c0_g1_i1.p1  ORF type:complete len:466 (+),score=139.53 TRINITY_DN3137_c0_g1_i1:124-1521(+)
MKNPFDFLWDPVDKPENPWRLITNLNHAQRLTFTAAFLGWALDAFDFFTVTLTLKQVAEEFGMKKSEVASAVTVCLMLRPVGAIIFGLLADRFGRRGPLMLNIGMYSLMEFLTGFAPNFTVFFILRALFGIAMGGEWGLGASLAMEALPTESRGIFSGILQQGYSSGHLLAAFVLWVLKKISPDMSWRVLYWVGASPALLIFFLRCFVPESKTFEKIHEKKAGQTAKTYLKSVFEMLKREWRKVLTGILMMAAFNFMSHGSQDLYPTFLEEQLGFSVTEMSVIEIVANVGAITGGTIIGYFSQYFGRRRTIVCSAFCAALFIPLWTYGPTTGLIMFGAFFLQFFVQGAWGVVPVHLNEMSPSDFRGFFPGVTYQIGNFISAASAQIEAKIGETFPVYSEKQQKMVPDYGKTQTIFMACVFTFVIIMVSFSYENRASDFDKADGESSRMKYVHLEEEDDVEDVPLH